MNRIAVVPGSFDPVTLGHIDVIGRAAGMFDELHVLVVHNPGKSALLPIAQRVSLLEQSIAEAGLPSNIRVTSWSVGLLVDYCTEGNSRAGGCRLRDADGHRQPRSRERGDGVPADISRERVRFKFAGSAGRIPRWRRLAVRAESRGFVPAEGLTAARGFLPRIRSTFAERWF